MLEPRVCHSPTGLSRARLNSVEALPAYTNPPISFAMARQQSARHINVRRQRYILRYIDFTQYHWPD